MYKTPSTGARPCDGCPAARPGGILKAPFAAVGGSREEIPTRRLVRFRGCPLVRQCSNPAS